MYKKRLQAFKVLEISKKPFFRLQNTRFLASKVSRGLGSSIYPKRAIVTSFCVLRPCTGSITNVDLKSPMLSELKDSSMSELSESYMEQEKKSGEENVGCYWRDGTNNTKMNWSLTLGVHVDSAGNLCWPPRCLISKEIPLRFILGSSLSMAPSKPYAEICAHKHNSPVFVAQG